MTEQTPETTEDQRPVETPEPHAERLGYGVTGKFPVPADETPATTDDLDDRVVAAVSSWDDDDLEDDE